ncbi:MAG: MFS transporter [Verrucomicrobiota bacterium]|nr:MFS transporter [Verrucomicrobiota bacterium]
MLKSHVRYFIVSMLFFASSINYADRATLSITKNSLSRDLGLDSVGMGYLFSAWAWSYVAAQIPCGWLLDRFGSKRVYGISFFLWSFFVFLMGFAGYLRPHAAYAALFMLMFLTGFSFAPTFPGNGRFVAAWFPARERGTASAIFNSSQYFSLVLFAPLMGWIVHAWGWEYVFWLMGALGMALTPAWFILAHSPRGHPRVSESELKYVEQGGGLVNMDFGAKSGTHFGLKWGHVRQLLGSRMLIGVYLGQFCITTLTYFFVQWFPGYLSRGGMSMMKAGLIVALSALCGCVGGILGGVFSDWLLRRGRTLTFARKLPIVLGMLLSCSMILCNYAPRGAEWLVAGIMCAAFFGKGFGALGWTVVSDTSPREITGLSGGLFNTFGNTAAITTGIVIGYLIKWTGSFSAALVYVGACAAGAIFFYLFVVGEIKRLELTS